jgi:hypothetical protein
MLITNTPPVAQLTTGWQTTPPVSKAPAASPSTAAHQEALPEDSFVSSVSPSTASTAPKSNAASPAASASATSAPKTSPESSAAPSKKPPAAAPVQGSAGASESTTIAGTYSTTAGGKSYSGSVEESGDTYTVSVGAPPLATASGSSVQSAESNLTVKIDTLV